MLRTAAATGALVTLLAGCAHQVQFQPLGAIEFSAVDHANAVLGEKWEESKALYEQAQLPHHSFREKYDLECQAGKLLRTPLGSEDYIMIGQINGGGTARASIDSLRQAMCERAAEKGGHAVLILNEGISEQPYTVVMPGQSTTHAYANAYAVGRSAYAYGTSHTTHSPGYAVSGVMYKPYAGGLVFRHVPGLAQLRARMSALSDDKLKPIDSWVKGRVNDKRTFENVFSEWQGLVAQAESQGNGSLTLQ